MRRPNRSTSRNKGQFLLRPYCSPARRAAHRQSKCDLRHRQSPASWLRLLACNRHFTSPISGWEPPINSARRLLLICGHSPHQLGSNCQNHHYLQFLENWRRQGGREAGRELLSAGLRGECYPFDAPESGPGHCPRGAQRADVCGHLQEHFGNPRTNNYPARSNQRITASNTQRAAMLIMKAFSRMACNRRIHGL
jgi:hypothetical protein